MNNNHAGNTHMNSFHDSAHGTVHFPASGVHGNAHFSQKFSHGRIERKSVRVVNGRRIESKRYYSPRYWGGHAFFGYTHFWGYNPWFWGFFWNPFARPWAYPWGWFGAPWYAAWGWAMYPYPACGWASQCITVSARAAIMADEYDAGYASGYAAAQQQDPQENAALQNQFDQQVTQPTMKAFQNNQPGIDLQTALANPLFMFIVSGTEHGTMSVVADGQSCNLTAGDYLSPFNPQDPKAAKLNPDPNAQGTTLRIMQSKGTCKAGAVVTMNYNDLQEMLNTQSEQLDNSSNTMQGQVGSQGAPAIPKS